MCGSYWTYKRAISDVRQGKGLRTDFSYVWQAQGLEVKTRDLRLVGLAERLRTQHHLHLPDGHKKYTQKVNKVKIKLSLSRGAQDRYGTF
jgi:hypothetical protein